MMGVLVPAFGAGCGGGYVPLPTAFPDTPTLVFGKVQVNLSGPTNRGFVPVIEFAELYNRDTGEGFRIDFRTNQSLFILPLAEGHYELTRIQIAEGAFRSMAQFSSSFHVQKDRLTYVGTWLFSVAPPYYDRAVTLTVSSEFTKAIEELNAKYPDRPSRVDQSMLPAPQVQETRLYEVMPYPRVKYYRRHPAT